MQQRIRGTIIGTRRQDGIGGLIVAIDGPAGVGKSTVARMLAQHCHLKYIDTGAMYRCVAIRARRQGILADDAAGLTECARSCQIDFRTDPENPRVFLGGEDVTDSIRDYDISSLASIVSQVAGVREAMVDLQRRMGSVGGVVMEGRDIGSVVFPDADVKVFLTASLDERARRRSGELVARSISPGLAKTEIQRDIEARDHRDQTRKISPLKPAPDAVMIDTEGLTIEEVMQRIMDLIAPLESRDRS